MEQDKLKVVIAQMTSLDELETNLNQMMALLQEIENPDDVDLVVFPECSLFLRINELTKIPPIELAHPIFAPLRDFALKHRIFLHLGSVPLRDRDRTYNSSIVITDEGKFQVPYRKIHLFDVEVEGHKPIRESDSFAPGKEPGMMELHSWKMGFTICYDIRFSELFLHYARIPVDLITIPAAFLVPTGQAHWEVLVRARAIESQCYVVAPAQSGIHQSCATSANRHTFGHSMVVSPWGEVLTLLKDKPGIAQLTLDKDRIKKVRAQIPMSHHRRL